MMRSRGFGWREAAADDRDGVIRALFAARVGAWYDPSDKSTLFQDAAGTVPVLASGDPVGLMRDKSGLGLHMAQAVNAARPTYRSNGTLAWLEYDGVDDRMVASALAYTQSTFGAVIGVEYLTTGANLNGAFKSSATVSSRAAGLSHRTADGATSLNMGTPSTFVNLAAAPTSRVALRAMLQVPAVGSVMGGAVASLVGASWQIVGYFTAAAPPAKLFGYVELDGMTNAERLLAVAWLAKKSGVVL